MSPVCLVPKLQLSLVPKLQLGNAIVCEAPASNASPTAMARLCPNLTKQSFGDKCVPKLELGNEEIREIPALKPQSRVASHWLP